MQKPGRRSVEGDVLGSGKEQGGAEAARPWNEGLHFHRPKWGKQKVLPAEGGLGALRCRHDMKFQVPGMGMQLRGRELS